MAHSIKLFTFILLAGVFNQAYCQQKDYAVIFGKDWKNAEEFLQQNSSWIKPVLKKYDIGYYESMSVIFPELIRYSAIRDKMETTLLKALYVNLGKEYANFSIGHFQMKPSFAEILGETSFSMLGQRFSSMVRDSSSFDDIRGYRSAIVKDLENPAAQLNYLIVFLKICSKKFNLRKMSADQKIKFLATAYNYGFFRNEHDIKAIEDRKFFSTYLVSRDFYSYSEISLYWYKLHTGHN